MRKETLRKSSALSFDDDYQRVVAHDFIPEYQSVKKPSYTPLLIILLVIASFFLGMLVTKVQYLEKVSETVSAQEAKQQPTLVAQPQPTRPQKVDVKLGSLPLLGNKDAKVTIIEFSDFQCPFCRRFFKDTFPQIKKEYIDTGKAKLSYRHFPLSFHPSAQKSAEASECSNDQGKFWEFHDKLYEEQEKQGQGTIQYTVDDIKKWAGELGLDTASFNQCLDSGKYTQKVTDETNAGTQAGVDGTPGFFINGQVVIGAQPFSAFKTIIDQELSK